MENPLTKTMDAIVKNVLFGAKVRKIAKMLS
jgi:hypothetical protein